MIDVTNKKNLIIREKSISIDDNHKSCMRAPSLFDSGFKFHYNIWYHIRNGTMLNYKSNLQHTKNFWFCSVKMHTKKENNHNQSIEIECGFTGTGTISLEVTKLNLIQLTCLISNDPRSEKKPTLDDWNSDPSQPNSCPDNYSRSN